jgi:hypothetical protein
MFDADDCDDAGNCEICGEDTSSLRVKTCSRCELQEYIDNDEKFDPRG